MPRGVRQDLIDNPVAGRCWCGKPFQKKADHQEHCCASHRVMASVARRMIPRMLPPAKPIPRKIRPDEVMVPDPAPDPTPGI